jgi:hypothetical protein
MKSERGKFYVYVHRKKSDGNVFYIGKGTGRRFKSKEGRNQHWKNVAEKHGWEAEIIAFFLQERCAFSYERILISLIGMNNLANKTNGGEGVSGYKAPPEVRAKLSAARLGAKKSPEHAEKVAAWHRGKKRPESTKKLISEKASERLSDPRRHWHASENVKTWWHEIYGIKIATHIEMSEDFDLSLEMLKRVESGSAFSYCGWKVAGVRNYSEKYGPNCNSFDPRVFVWAKPGESNFIGTRWDFASAKGIDKNSTYGIASGQTKTLKGWRARKI